MDTESSSTNIDCLDSKKCDRAMMVFYLLLLILVLILVGNLIQTGTTKGGAWALFSLVLILGLVALFFIFKGGKLKKYGLPIIAILNMLMLFIAMLIAKPTASLGEKFGAHIANILSAVAIGAALFLTKH